MATTTDSSTATTTTSNSASLSLGINNILNIQNAATGIQFTQAPTSYAVHDEMGVFVVDDAQGKVAGILPGNAGYLAAAIKRSQVIGGNVDTGSSSSRQLSFADGTKLGSYLVQNGTTAEIKNDLLAGQAPSHPVFFQSDNLDNSEHLRVTAAGNKYIFGWDDTVVNRTAGSTAADFKDLVVDLKLASSSITPGANLQSSTPLIDARDISGVQSASITVGGNSSYDNLVGFYTVDDPTGKIGNLNPNDPGYARAAIDRSFASYDKNTKTTTTQITGGNIFAPYLIANGNVQDLLTKNPNNLATDGVPHAYFGYIGANSDRIEHIRLLGDNQFAFEDTLGGGDRDFNDATIGLKIGT
jgi:Domain of unknown function (DUF4114)